MARFCKTRFPPRISPKLRASSSSRPRLPGGFVRLSRCRCSKGRISRLGRWISGKESGIGYDLHKLKGCSKTVAGDPAEPALKIHRCEYDHQNGTGQREGARHSTEQEHACSRYDSSNTKRPGRESLHEF